MTTLKKTATAIVSSGIALIGGSIAKAEPSQVPWETEVQACVAQINERVDRADATRIRHNVVLLEETRLKYRFSIGTSIYTGTDDIAARKYTAYCVVLGDGTPVSFSIKDDLV